MFLKSIHKNHWHICSQWEIQFSFKLHNVVFNSLQWSHQKPIQIQMCWNIFFFIEMMFATQFVLDKFEFTIVIHWIGKRWTRAIHTCTTLLNFFTQYTSCIRWQILFWCFDVRKSAIFNRSHWFYVCMYAIMYTFSWSSVAVDSIAPYIDSKKAYF